MCVSVYVCMCVYGCMCVFLFEYEFMLCVYAEALIIRLSLYIIYIFFSILFYLVENHYFSYDCKKSCFHFKVGFIILLN